MKKCLAGAALGFLLFLSACTVGGGAPITYTEIRVPTLQGSGSFDAIEVDQQTQTLYVADRTDSGIDVIDLTSSPATFTHTIPLGASANGLAYAPDLKKLFVGLVDGQIAIIDQHEKVTMVPGGGRTVDLVDYSPTTHEVFAGVDNDTVSRIDALTGQVKNVMKLAAKGIEQPRYNPVDQMLYVTSPGSGLLVVDPTTGTLKNSIDLGNCAARGMAINTKLDQALVACRTWAQRVNLRNTSDQQPFAQVEGGDVVNYYPASDRFLVGMPDAIPSGVGVLGGNPINYIATARTHAGGNSAALDEASHMVYAPDTRPATVGLIAFDLPSEEPGFSIDPSSLIELGFILGAIGLVVVVIGRGGDPANRPEPLPTRRRRGFSRN